MHPLAKLDHAHVWHPFTQMQDWLKREPLVIVRGDGAELEDAHGHRYLDANSSIWTNLHGHNHPRINAAIRSQLDKVAHSSALGLANEPASQLAARLVNASNTSSGSRSKVNRLGLNKVFFSDDGSTALEVALKMAYEFTRRTRGSRSRPRFLSLEGAYHGDTVGAVSMGHIDLFNKVYHQLLFKTDSVMAPYCYRCPFNRAAPERADARDYRKCNWECVGKVERALEMQARKSAPYAAFIVEPRMQGAAGMIPQPDGWLGRVTEAARAHGTMLITDEVMTGFGRTGGPRSSSNQRPRRKATTNLFACHAEGVQPDFLCLAKGLTGGYLPMAATLTTQEVFDAFLGDYSEFKTFFHGHSYTGNQLGAAAALASLSLLQDNKLINQRSRLAGWMSEELGRLWTLPNVGDIRQAGLVAGIELVRDWRTKEPFDLRDQAGIRVCEAMAGRGVLTRPVGNVVVIIPPYCTTRAQLRRIIRSLRNSVHEVLHGAR